MLEDALKAPSKSIILIGPIGAGKSTVAALLAERTGLPRHPMDELRWDYYRQAGYDDAGAAKAEEREGFYGLAQYWKPFEADVVERIVVEHPDSVIDFGAGHSVYEEAELFARVQRALTPFPNVVLLLPSPDPDESVRILQKRKPIGGAFDFPEHFVKHHSNHDLAKIVVYSGESTPEETADEVLRRVAAAKNR